MRARAVERLGEALLLLLVLFGGVGAFLLLSGAFAGLMGAATPYGLSLPGDGSLFCGYAATLLIALSLLALGILLLPGRAERAASSRVTCWPYGSIRVIRGMEADALALASIRRKKAIHCFTAVMVICANCVPFFVAASVAISPVHCNCPVAQ